MVNLSFVRLSLQMRTQFKVPDKNLLLWFPGHMGKGLKQMQQKLKSVDCIIEVHDARIPFSGRNRNFKQTVSGLKPHILILNKMDLADLSKQREIESRLKYDGYNHVVFTNSKDRRCEGMRKIVPLARNLIAGSLRYNRSETKEFNLMVIGVPNVGKSTVINSLRNIYLKKSNAAQVGAIAGITRSVGSRIKVSHDPLMYILDTPGILEPSVENERAALKLALCSSMQDHLVGKMLIADFLLYWMNKHDHFSYVNYLGLQYPTDDIKEVLVITAMKNGKTLKIRNTQNEYEIKPDLDTAASMFIGAFRKGELGTFVLDELNANKNKF